MGTKSKYIEELLATIKENNIDFYNKLINENISEEEIWNKSNEIIKFLKNKKMKVDITDGHLLIFNDEETKEFLVSEKAFTLKQHYLIGAPSNDLLLLDIDKNSFQPSKQRESFINYVEKFVNQRTSKGCYISGPTGVGKTYALILLLNKYVEINTTKTVGILNLSFEYTNIKTTFGTKSDRLFNLINNSILADVLVIDDIGAEEIEPWSRDSILLPILDKRATTNKITLFTSNYSIKKLSEVYKKQNKKSNFIKGSLIKEQNSSERITNRIKYFVDNNVFYWK